jgi:Tfp pilus assembly PilM family ATPase
MDNNQNKKPEKASGLSFKDSAVPEQKPAPEPVPISEITPVVKTPDKPVTPHADILNRYYTKMSFMQRLNARKYLSLDIDIDKVRYMVGIKAGRNFQAISWGIQKFPAEESNRLKALQITLENIRVKIYKPGMLVEACFYSPDINIRQITLPKMNKKSDLEKAILFKNQQDLQNFDEKSFFSYQILDEFEEEQISKLQILVVAASSETITRYLTLLSEAKLTVTKLIPRPAALQAAYSQMVQKPERDLVIHISYDFTQICFLKNRRLEYFRNLGIGARNLEVIIHGQKGEAKPEAEMKIPGADALAESDSSNILRKRLLEKVKDLQQKQNPVLHTFFSEILRFLAYVQGKDKKDFVDRIYITGYGLQKESLLPYLRGRLNMPIHIMAPELTPDLKQMPEHGEHFTTIGTLHQTNPTYNLTPANYRSRIAIKKINAILVLVIIATFSMAVYFSYLTNGLIQKKQNYVQQLQKEYDKLNPIEGSYRKLINDIERIMAENKELQGYVKSSTPLLDLMRLLSNETPSQVRLERLIFMPSDHLSVQKSKKTKASAKGNPEKAVEIELSGVVHSGLLVGDVILINFINRLNELKYFSKIELLDKNKDAEKDLTTFTLHLILKES